MIVTETRSNDAYSFTANANTNIAYVANGLNQGKQADATVYGFDANGNLTSDGWFTFAYDLENKLVSALPINAGVRTLNYDPVNRLDLYNPGTAKRFIYDGPEVAAEFDSSGNIIARYVRGDAPDEIITGYTSSNPTARGWYHLDQRNSVIAVTDPNGAVTVVNRYDEYGQPQGGNYGTFQYTGQMWLGEIGVYNYKNRMYWPNERPGGGFLQADPTGYGPGMNRYVYVNGNPVNAVDPSGTEGRAFFGIDTDDRSPTRDFTPQGTGWGHHSYDWMGQMGTPVSGRLDETRYSNEIYWSQFGDSAYQCAANQACGGSSATQNRTMSATLRALLRDTDVVTQMRQAWHMSFGHPGREYVHEHGFWIQQVGNDYRALGIQEAMSSERNAIILGPSWGTSIWFHTHPFAGYGGLSRFDKSTAWVRAILMIAYSRSGWYEIDYRGSH